MSSATVCNCRHNTPDPEGLRAMSSKQSASNRKRPTAVRAEPVAWYGQLVTAGRTQTQSISTNPNRQPDIDTCDQNITVTFGQKFWFYTHDNQIVK